MTASVERADCDIDDTCWGSIDPVACTYFHANHTPTSPFFAFFNSIFHGLKEQHKPSNTSSVDDLPNLILVPVTCACHFPTDFILSNLT